MAPGSDPQFCVWCELIDWLGCLVSKLLLSLLPQFWHLRCALPRPASTWVLGDLNSASQTYTAGAFPSQPSPTESQQSLSLILDHTH